MCPASVASSRFTWISRFLTLGFALASSVALALTSGPYSMRVAAEYQREPRLALDAGGDGMDIVARILRQASDHLERDGLLICEVGGSVEEFEARWPRLPVTWITFQRGGDGVFSIGRDALQKARATL